MDQIYKYNSGRIEAENLQINSKSRYFFFVALEKYKTKQQQKNQ